MRELLEAFASFGIFTLAGVGGLFVRSRLPAGHRNQETQEFLRFSVGALVTFLAIVTGLLTASSKQHFDQVSVSYRHLAAKVVQLDGELRSVGPDADLIRTEMRSYLAAVIFSTWPDEPAPSGVFPTGLAAGQKEGISLTELLRHVEDQIRALKPGSPTQAQTIAAATRDFAAFNDARWTVIETAHPTIPTPFYNLMRFWTALVLFGFGLAVSRNIFVALIVLTCAISLASVIYVILELDDPVGGWIAISSQPLRDALADIDRS